MKLLVLVQTDLFLVWWYCTVQKDEILVDESIGDEESVGTHVIFFKLLRRFSLSFSTLSLSVALLNGCMTAHKVILGKFSPPFQQELPFLRWPAAACLGPHSPISLPPFLYFLAFSQFSSIRTLFPACLFAPLIQFLPQCSHNVYFTVHTGHFLFFD